MATSAFCYQIKAQNLCADSPQHCLRELAGGWPTVSNAACLGVLRISHLGRFSCYHCVMPRQIDTSNGCFHDVKIHSPAEKRGYTRALRQCNALLSSVGAVERDEECAVILRSAVQSRSDCTRTVERVILSAVDRTDLDEELLHAEDRITGALHIGVVGCRRSASWICFGGGPRPRRKRAWKTTNRKGSFAKARKLVDTIMQVPSAKEEIYGALDAFVAWELEFPIIAIKKALQFMAQDQQWKPVIQVTKWMLSKGQGRTLGTYTLLLQALDHEGRVEEADSLWEKLLTEHEEVTPRMMFTVVIAMFERHNQPRRLLQLLESTCRGDITEENAFVFIKVFADMEELEVKPDIATVERAARAYRGLGLMKRADVVEAKYPATKWGWRYSKRGKKYRIRVTADGEVINPENSSQLESEADDGEGKGDKQGDEEDTGDSDSHNNQFSYTDEFEEENPYALNSDNVLPSVGHRP